MKNKIFIKSLFVICAFILSTPAFALQWGVFDDYDSKYQTRYGLSQILNTGSVYFSITQEETKNKPTKFQNEEENVKNELGNALNEENRKNELSSVVKQAFKLWFTETRKAIKEAGREDEFADIIPLLDRSVKAILVDYKPNRNFINFSFTTNTRMHSLCSDVAGACFYRATKEIFFPNPFTEEIFYTKKALMGYLRTTTVPMLAHEIGHYYGLVDQYENFGDASSVYKTSDRYSRGSSMMGAADKIYCDDVDGFINLIDITLSKQNGWSQRAKNGWASFCNGKNVPNYAQNVSYKDTYYKMGRPVKSLAENVPVASTTTPKSANNTNTKPSANNQIKPFTFYSSKYQYNFTYNKNNLIATKKDDSFFYKYSYYRNNGELTIKVSAVGKEFFATKKTFEGKKAWELPAGYDIEGAYSTKRYIYADNYRCHIVNYVPFSDKRSYSVDYIDGKLQPEYTYSLPLGDSIVKLHKYESLGHPVCQVTTNFDIELIKFVGSAFDSIEGMVGVGKNPYILDDIAKAAGKTRGQIIDRLKTECKKTLHQSITNNTKELCSYFRKVDNYFNK